MQLDLGLLQAMHPVLPATRAADIAHCAAVALQLRGHAPGAQMAARLDDKSHETTLGWTASVVGAELGLDRKRITEDAAEAISLALVNVAFGWVIKRRLQQGEAGDWLLEDDDENLVALEVSGTDGGDWESRLRLKTEQVAGAQSGCRRTACVVELASPYAVAAGCGPAL